MMIDITYHSDAVNYLSQLYEIAECRGSFMRFPERFNREPNTTGNVAYVCDNLDALKVPFSVQNKALAVISNVDIQSVWEMLYKHDYKTLAVESLEIHFKTNN